MAPPLCIHLRTDQPTNHPPRRRRRRRRCRLTPASNPLSLPRCAPRAQPFVRGSPSAVVVKAPRVGKGFSALYLFNWTTKRHFPRTQSETYTPSLHLTYSPSLFLSPLRCRTRTATTRAKFHWGNSTENRTSFRSDTRRCGSLHYNFIATNETSLVVRSWPPPNLIYRVTCLSREDIDRSLCVYGCGTSTSLSNIFERIINPFTNQFLKKSI